MITTISSRKGGVTKTTTSVSLAHSLARAGYLTLLIDRDSQLNTLDCLGLRKLNETGVITPGIYDCGRPNLHVYPAGNEHDVDLLALAGEYDAIIIDCPPDDFVQRTTLPYADVAIIPAKCEALAVRGALVTMEMIRRIALPPRIYLLPVLYNGSKTHEECLADMTDLVADTETAPMIYQNGNVPRGQKYGQTIYECNGRGIVDLRHQYDIVAEWLAADITRKAITL
jgi:chromosome partitioning protein